jgi:hypothetical protein
MEHLNMLRSSNPTKGERSMKKIVIVISILLVIFTGIFIFNFSFTGKNYVRTQDECAADAKCYNDSLSQKNFGMDTTEFNGGNALYNEEVVNTEIIERKVIKNCEIRLKVSDLERTVNEIENKTEVLGGILGEVRINKNEYNESLNGNMILRIPSTKFNEMVEIIEKKGEVESCRKYINDVTEEYIDIEAKVKVLKTEEKSLLSILENAKKIEDILKIKEHLTGVRKERESLEGRLNYLKNKVNYSTIEVNIYQPITGDSEVQITGCSGTMERGKKALIKSINYLFKFFEEVIVFGFALIPVILLLLILAVVIVVLKKFKNMPKNNQDKK